MLALVLFSSRRRPAAKPPTADVLRSLRSREVRARAVHRTEVRREPVLEAQLYKLGRAASQHDLEVLQDEAKVDGWIQAKKAKAKPQAR